MGKRLRLKLPNLCEGNRQNYMNFDQASKHLDIGDSQQGVLTKSHVTILRNDPQSLHVFQQGLSAKTLESRGTV